MTRLLLIAGIIAMIYWFWRSAAGSPGTMSRAEAARLLGVAEDADAETIAEAHKRLIAKVHPDAGGSAELAARVNDARDILTRALSR